MQEGLLAPVHKRGLLSAVESFRGLVVSCVLHKVYAWCVNTYLRTWLYQENQKGANLLPRQCGFLPRRSTVNNMFILQNAVHHACGHRKSLCVLLLDVASAYDSVDQAQLLANLQGMGVPQHLVRAIQGMYSARDELGNLAEPFPVGKGVKQGCPASPLLFCLYVQGVSKDLEGLERGHAEAYTLPAGGNNPLPDWAYADDFMLLTVGVGGMQRLADGAARSFLLQRLKLEPGKCVVFCVRCDEAEAVRVDGHEVPFAPQGGTRLLGLMFDRTASASCMVQHRGACMLTAYRCARAKVYVSSEVPCSIPVITKLMKVAVEPAGVYGCELWGLLSVPGVGAGDFSVRKLFALADPMEKKRAKVLRAWLNLPKGTPYVCLLHELGLKPLVHAYVIKAVKWWNHVVGLKPDSPWRLAMEQNVQDHRKASFTGLNFAGALFSALKVVLGERGLATSMASMDKFDITVVEERLGVVYGQHLEWLRTGPQQVVGTMVQWYMRVVGLHQPGELPCWYTLNVPQCVIIRFMRFRLGCHFLRNNTGRWQHMKPYVPPLQGARPMGATLWCKAY
jgi:hypothetical protein